MKKLSAIAGADAMPWIWTITADDGYPEVDLDASDITLRISKGGIGKLDVTTANGLTVDSSTISVSLTAVQTTALGIGEFTFDLLISPPGAGPIDPDAEGDGHGTLSIPRRIPTAPA